MSPIQKQPLFRPPSTHRLYLQIAVDAAREKAQRAAATAGPSYAKPGSSPTQTGAAAPALPTDALPQMPPTESPLLAGARVLAMQEVRAVFFASNSKLRNLFE